MLVAAVVGRGASAGRARAWVPALARLPLGERHLERNSREDLIRYLDAWAELLREQLDRRLREAGNAA